MSQLPVWMQAVLALMAFLQFLLLVFILPLRGAIDRLKESDEALRDKLSAWQIEVATNYVRRDEVAAQHREVLAAIQRLEQGLSGLQRDKADK